MFELVFSIAKHASAVKCAINQKLIEAFNIIWYDCKDRKNMHLFALRRQNVIAGSIFLIIGLILLLAGIIFVICWRHLARYSGETTGVITDITWSGYRYNKRAEEDHNENHKLRVQVNRNTGSSRNNMYTPVFQYAVDGRTYSRASGLAYNKGIAQKKLGKTVPVYYNVNNPQKASLSNGKGYKMLGLGFSIGGILFCIIGFALIIADHMYLIYLI